MSFYVGDGDGGLAETAMRALVGIVGFRGYTSWDSMGQAKELGRQLKRLGKDVPIFWLSTERSQSLSLWEPHEELNLERPPYRLEDVAY